MHEKIRPKGGFFRALRLNEPHVIVVAAQDLEESNMLQTLRVMLEQQRRFKLVMVSGKEYRNMRVHFADAETAIFTNANEGGSPAVEDPIELRMRLDQIAAVEFSLKA